MSPVKVVSQQPPGGRCTLYARYAEAVSKVLGWNHRIVHSECRDAHGAGFPSLWIGAVTLAPADGVILSPEDVVAHLAGCGVDAARLDALHHKLDAILEDFLESSTN